MDERSEDQRTVSDTRVDILRNEEWTLVWSEHLCVAELLRAKRELLTEQHNLLVVAPKEPTWAEGPPN